MRNGWRVSIGWDGGVLVFAWGPDCRSTALDATIVEEATRFSNTADMVFGFRRR
jgi:hypothetical protein